MRRSGAIHCTDMISTYGCLLWNGKKPPPAKSCWSRCKLTTLQYSAEAWCRKWAHYCTSTPTTPHPPPLHQTSPLPTTCAGLIGGTPTPPPCLLQSSSPPQHKLLYSCTSSPNRTLNTLCCFTLHCLHNISEDMIWFTANCLDMYAVVTERVYPNQRVHFTFTSSSF